MHPTSHMPRLHLSLEPHHEYYAAPSEATRRLEHALGFPPLWHQLETYLRLQTQHVVFNTFPTGTGKTLAAYAYLLERPQSDALIIAPTNALISQHAQDLADFKASSGIPHLILELDAAKLRSIQAHYPEMQRRQDIFQRLLENPYEFHEVLGLQLADKAAQTPLVLITNPDLFYYALYGLVNVIDRRNIQAQMLSVFDYIIIDEFHYYDAKQFSVFLFFIALSHAWGFFSAEVPRRIAILSATPNQAILQYFERLAAQGLRYTLVSPEEQPTSSKSVSTLAPMELELIPFASRQSADFAGNFSLEQLRTYLEAGLTGAVISDRLLDISLLAAKLRGAKLWGASLGRRCEFEKITGAVSKKDRPTILRTPLLLATPTVDIGYNFRREDKQRQNIDFLYFIAHYYDEFWQRLGRAGRVLGKKEQDFPARLQILVPEPSDEGRFYALEGENLSHGAFKQHSAELLSEKAFNRSYIASQGWRATLASFAVMHQSLSHDDRYLLETAITTVQEIFAPQARYPLTLQKVRGYVAQERRLNEVISPQKMPSQPLLKEFLRFTYQRDDEEAASAVRQALRNDTAACQDFNDYIKARRAVRQARQSFRGSGEEILVSVYDPQHFLTNQLDYTEYNLLHLLRYFELYLYEDAHAFQQDSGVPTSQLKAMQVRLLRLLEPEERAMLRFRLDDTSNTEVFQRCYLHRLWAFKGIQLQLEKQGALRPLEPRLQAALADSFLPMMLFTLEDSYPIQKYLYDFKIYPRNISINFSSTGKSLDLLAIVGAAGESALKRLERYQAWCKKRPPKPDFDIC